MHLNKWLVIMVMLISVFIASSAQLDAGGSIVKEGVRMQTETLDEEQQQQARDSIEDPFEYAAEHNGLLECGAAGGRWDFVDHNCNANYRERCEAEVWNYWDNGKCFENKAIKCVLDNERAEWENGKCVILPEPEDRTNGCMEDRSKFWDGNNCITSPIREVITDE